MELLFHFTVLSKTLPLFDYGDTVYTDALESITEHCLSAAMVSHCGTVLCMVVCLFFCCFSKRLSDANQH